MKPAAASGHWASTASVRQLVSLFLLLSLFSTVECKSSEQEHEAICCNQESTSHQQRHRARRLTAAQASQTAAPEFGPPIGNVSVVAGRDVRLVCTVDNLGQYQVAWLKEETKTILSIDTNIIITNYRIFLIPDEEGRKWVLHIKDVQESDRGFYRCQVNTNPMISTLGYLEVVVPPKIIEADTTQTVDVIEHGNVSLQCKASGHPRPTISWRREDGEPIRLTGNGVPASARTSEEASRDPSKLNSSSLDGNEGGEMGSLSDAELRKREARESQTTTYSPTIVLKTTELQDVRSDKLTLTNVDRTMAGLYVCSASNGIPSQASRQIPVYVKFPPKVTIVQRPSVSVALGEQLELECMIEAFPKASSYWSGRQAASSKLSQVRFAAAPPVGVAGASRPRWFRDGGAAAQRPTKLDHERMQMLVAAPAGAGGRVLEQRHYSANKRPPSSPLEPLEMRGANETTSTLTSSHEQQQSVQLAPGVKVGPSEAIVTVKQTPVNAYTYKLKLSVAQVRPGDLGEYVCISSNSMGSSSARIQVRGKREPQNQVVERVASSSAAFLASHGERETEYQRDSLAGEPAGSLANSQQLWASNQLIHVTSSQGEPARKPSFARPNRVYDENYLQAIRSRQASASSGQVGKLQTRFKSLSNSATVAARCRTTQASLWPLMTLLFVNMLARWRP